eukprot:947220-Amphidinium_carterae.1
MPVRLNNSQVQSLLRADLDANYIHAISMQLKTPEDSWNLRPVLHTLRFVVQQFHVACGLSLASEE